MSLTIRGSVSAKIKSGTAIFGFGTADFKNGTAIFGFHNCQFLVSAWNAFCAVLAISPHTSTYFCYNSLGQRTLAVEDMNRNGQIDWSVADRVVSNDTRYVTYNGENRPVRWVRESDNTTIAMSYDHMGRRREKNAQRFFYDGYLQICSYHSPTLNSNGYIWDTTEPVATRPLVWQTNNCDYFYAHDGNKNVSEVVDSDVGIAAHYEYAPFGAVIVRRGDSVDSNPWRFSSEFSDDEIDCNYYNYRHYNPRGGKWIVRDSMERDSEEISKYGYVSNGVSSGKDVLGLLSFGDFIPFYSTVEMGLVYWLGGVPGQYATEYPYISQSDCKDCARRDAAKAACLEAIALAEQKYIREYLISVSAGRVLDVFGQFVKLIPHPIAQGVGKALEIDALAGASIGAAGLQAIGRGAAEAAENNCECF